MTDMTGTVNVLQTQNQILTALLKQFAAGVVMQPTLPVYTVASLPTTAAVGQLAYASNGRKNGQGAGTGTGTVVWFDVSNQWFAVWSSAAVTV